MTDIKPRRQLSLQEMMDRPARRQIQDVRKDTAYVEGNYDYNIWYDKFLTDRWFDTPWLPSQYWCNPDTGKPHSPSQIDTFKL